MVRLGDAWFAYYRQGSRYADRYVYFLNAGGGNVLVTRVTSAIRVFICDMKVHAREPNISEYCARFGANRPSIYSSNEFMRYSRIIV